MRKVTAGLFIALDGVVEAPTNGTAADTILLGRKTAGLLDELHLLLHPIAAGKGMRLFDEGGVDPVETVVVSGV